MPCVHLSTRRADQEVEEERSQLKNEKEVKGQIISLIEVKGQAVSQIVSMEAIERHITAFSPLPPDHTLLP